MGYREAEGMLKNQTSLSLNSALPHPNFCKWFFFFWSKCISASWNIDNEGPCLRESLGRIEWDN